MAEVLHHRLLLDIAELQTKPYPNVFLHVDDDSIDLSCLILKVEGYGLLHMTIEFPTVYPLQAPIIRMDSDIAHPNVFGGNICASILNTAEGWTPAYTLKGIAIQLLSFFASDAIDLIDGQGRVDLHDYRAKKSGIMDQTRSFVCPKCGYDGKGSEETTIANSDGSLKLNLETSDIQSKGPSSSKSHPEGSIQSMALPNEVVLLICENLDTEDLMLFAKAWSRVSSMMTQYDLLRTRELQCFLSKQDYKMTKLGVGVQVDQEGKRQGRFSSEFDLVSDEAFWKLEVRRSVQGIKFQYWLPLPISKEHWKKVQEKANWNLQLLSKAANLGDIPPFKVIYHFMNDVVVKLFKNAPGNPLARIFNCTFEETAKSPMMHASEKAIESYFHLFHLLICLAVDDDTIVKSANSMIDGFIKGETSKSSCPNLGHLLVASLISDVEISNEGMESIIKETITRNVVWMLGREEGGFAGLSYMEPSEISKYRLEKTFEAGKTSYRILMFLNLFRTTTIGNPRKPLSQLATEAFERHGAPPRGSAKNLANDIKRIHLIDSFPDFFEAMGMAVPGNDWLTNLLRECIINKGYSRMPITQSQALYLRQLEEKNVELVDGLQPVRIDLFNAESFFPGNGSDPQGNRGGGRGGRRRGRDIWR